ncbi:MAG: hypothetical protein ACI4SY_07370 [Sutterella sp.]
MKVDYEKFPEIPPGCQLNENKKQGLYQVFREGKHRSPGCTKRRESIGTIRKGVFTPSKQWLLTQKLAEMNERAAKAEQEAAERPVDAPVPDAEPDAAAAESANLLSAGRHAEAAIAEEAVPETAAEHCDAETPLSAEPPAAQADDAAGIPDAAANGEEADSDVSEDDPLSDVMPQQDGTPESAPTSENADQPAQRPEQTRERLPEEKPADADAAPAVSGPIPEPAPDTLEIDAPALEVNSPEDGEDQESPQDGFSPAHLLTALYLQALTGSDGAAEDFVRRRGAMLKEAVPGMALSSLTERHAADVLRFIDPKAFEKTAFRLMRPVLQHAFERTAVQNTLSASRDSRGRVMLSISLGGRSADPALLEGLRVSGCAMITGSDRIPNRLLESLLSDGAGYLIPLTGAHAVKAAGQLFNRSRPRPISDEEAGEVSETGETRRSLALLLGTSLNPAFRERWPGSETGTVIRLRTEKAVSGFSRTAANDRFFVTTLPLRDDLLGTIAALAAEAAADGAEERLVIRDVFRDDRLADADPTVTACRLALRASARAMLEENRLTQLGSGAAESMLSLRAQPLRCFDVKDALECLGRALGLC